MRWMIVGAVLALAACGGESRYDRVMKDGYCSPDEARRQLCVMDTQDPLLKDSERAINSYGRAKK